MLKAMIFAAGLGTRMRPITDNIPKALVSVDGIPLLEIVIRRLKYFGITDIIINVHYLAEQIEAFLAQNNNFGVNITISDERTKLLETGGGLKKAQYFFDDDNPFLICNTDVLSNIDIQRLFEAHQKNAAIATLAVQQRPSSRYLLFDDDMKLCGWQNTKTNDTKIVRPYTSAQLTPLAFSTYQIISPRIFDYFPPEKEVFSTIDVFLAAAKNNIIKGYNHSEDTWIDVGTPANIPFASDILSTIKLL